MHALARMREMLQSYIYVCVCECVCECECVCVCARARACVCYYGICIQYIIINLNAFVITLMLVLHVFKLRSLY